MAYRLKPPTSRKVLKNYVKQGEYLRSLRHNHKITAAEYAKAVYGEPDYILELQFLGMVGHQLISLTIAQLASLSGLHHATISRLETGRQAISLEHIKILSDIYLKDIYNVLRSMEE